MLLFLTKKLNLQCSSFRVRVTWVLPVGFSMNQGRFWVELHLGTFLRSYRSFNWLLRSCVGDWVNIRHQNTHCPTVQFDTTPAQSHRNLKTANSPSSHYPQCTLFTVHPENLLKNCLQFIMRWLLYKGKNWKQWLRKILRGKQTVLYGHSENGDVKFKRSVALVSKEES